MKGNCVKLERWDGTVWATILKRCSVTAPELSRETVEEDLTLDCTGNGSATKKKSPGTKEIGDIEVEVIYNAKGPKDFADGAEVALTNGDNHHLFLTDYENETATFWRVLHPDGSGSVTHATVKTVGSLEYKPNETVKRTITIEPTGEFHKEGANISDLELPDSPTAPTDHWGSDE